ncbi:MAG: hypothetical protein HGA97_11740 [Chlorobiaceae bacterium]|nr:hypothetical protein [Chlorobiaceae bacterium]
MKCPECKSVDLLITERQGIEIDYCPECRGVWLDKGELDKIIERSLVGSVSNEYRSDSRYMESHHGHHDHEHEGHGYSIDPRTGKRKKHGGPLGFLGELFD